MFTMITNYRKFIVTKFVCAKANKISEMGIKKTLLQFFQTAKVKLTYRVRQWLDIFDDETEIWFDGCLIGRKSFDLCLESMMLVRENFFFIHDWKNVVSYEDEYLCWPVIPNQCTAEHLGATKKCQGCGQIWYYCLCIDVLLHKVRHILIFNPAGVPPNFF